MSVPTMRYLVALVVWFQIGAASAQGLPENARPAPFGSGWLCVRGYYKAGDRCLKVKIPENGTLDYTGSNWTCVRGYRKAGDGCGKVVVPDHATLDYTGANWTCIKGYRRSGDGCSKVIVPEHATLDYTGANWVCAKGYRRSGDGCTKVVVPENATLDYTGANWACVKGYRRSGDVCVSIVVPQNAKLDFTGNNWACMSGYKRAGEACVPMTLAEAERQRIVEEKIRQRIAARQVRLARGEDCQTEFKTNAEICVVVTRASIDCNKSFLGSYYDDCDVTLSYDVRTNYSGGSSIHTDVDCKVEVEYSGKSTFSSSDSQRKSDTHDLYANSSTSERFTYNFSFSSFEEVTRARLTSAKCEIESVDLF